MKVLFSLIAIAITLISYSQEFHPEIICYASSKVENTRVGVLNRHRHATAPLSTTQTSTFEVEYVGFTDEAKAAFQHAVDIWSSILSSDVTIRITANWELLGPGVLGSAGSNGSARNFAGAPLQNIDYPIALAEKLARRDLNSTFAPDINARFSSGIDWYYGLDGNPSAGEYDLVSVVLHEIGHGLGIAGSFGSNVATQIADHSLFTGFPRIYDTYLYSGNNLIIDRNIYDSQSAIYQVTTSGNVTFNSEIAKARNGAFFPPIFSPSPYNPGSSISHLDESTYPAGDPNSLMTPQIGQAEAIHDPGDVLYGIMIDMGWEYAFFNHTAIGDTEDEASNLSFVTDIDSDMGYSNVMLNYSIDGGSLISVAMNVTGNTDEYNIEIANPGASSISYFFSIEDEYGRSINGDEFSFAIGPDNISPMIVHEPVTTFRKFGNDVFPEFNIAVSDNIGIASAQVEYRVNGGAIETLDIDSESITLPLDITQLEFGDIVEYRINAQDNSSNLNVSVLPEVGFYEILVIDIITESYEVDFDLDGGRTFDPDDIFTVEQPTGFNSLGYHSAHPYVEGTDQTDYYLNFLGDIVLGQQTLVLEYEDIALIEPGLAGSQFGTGAFADYISLEGSADGGNTWITLSGYDASYTSTWLDKYNENIVNGNSLAEANSSLYEAHAFKLNEFFQDNSIVKLRFHLFTNSANVGWGWAIKNFSISTEVPLSVKKDDPIFIYPNPVSEYLHINGFNKSDTYQILDANGKIILKGFTSDQITTQTLDSGVYHLVLTTPDGGNKKMTFIKK
ncbi:T9SS type A sorting domain-containing protein [Ekhidna sp. To15]|uniref:T9SS type A sorting domain-containing protein n=1 Tax=Ekhidna sp. To15 TaxID=3395267 RepID=UPI003F528537